MMWPFYLMALVAIVSTIRVVTNANPVHALLLDRVTSCSCRHVYDRGCTICWRA